MIMLHCTFFAYERVPLGICLLAFGTRCDADTFCLALGYGIRIGNCMYVGQRKGLRIRCTKLYAFVLRQLFCVLCETCEIMFLENFSVLNIPISHTPPRSDVQFLGSSIRYVRTLIIVMKAKHARDHS